MHGKDYDDIEVSVHGGLTFGELITEETLEFFTELTKEDIGCWMVGFDTAHYNDNIAVWPKERVQRETEELAAQLAI
jgi:hypothetical protein